MSTNECCENMSHMCCEEKKLGPTINYYGCGCCGNSTSNADGSGDGHSPYIGENGNWFEWSAEANDFADTEVRAEGLQGEKGDKGDQGEPGFKGDKGSNQADYRLHYCVELFGLRMIEMHLTESAEGEKLTRYQNIGKEDIVLADRAYGTLKSIAYLDERGSDYVIRLRSNYFNLYDENAQKVSLLPYFEKLAENETGSVSLYYKSKDGYMPIRICAIRKTKEAEMDGISRIKKSNTKKMRGKVSEIQSAYNKYVIVATSLPSDVTANRILELYRMRWQIELVFKRLKSIFNYDEMPSKSAKTIEAWFYGKLLIAAICEALVNKGRFSPMQA